MKRLLCTLFLGMGLLLGPVPYLYAQQTSVTPSMPLAGYLCPGMTGATLQVKNVSAAFAGSGNIKILTGAASKTTKLYRLVVFNGNASAMQFGLTEGTGTNCGTGTVTLSGVFSNQAQNTNFDLNFTTGPMVLNTPADDLCLNQGTAITQTVTGFLLYCQD